MTYLLTPLSWGYGFATWLRNKFFDWDILHEEEFQIPIVSVGNITVGGTGKTPHVEYIVRMLSPDYKIAVLSRGYKRKTKGYVLANMHSTPDMIGDEPLQIYQKFGKRIKVAVCEKRREGIRNLLATFPDLQLILLDDAFQHRYVKPKVSILLMDYNRPFYNDRILPLGRLRESDLQVNRADMVIVTKCPDDMTPLKFRLVSKNLDLMKYQKLFFSKYEYGLPEPVFSDESIYQVDLDSLTAQDSILLLTGIAHPRYFVRHFKNYPFRIKVEHFPDHHNFTRKDIELIVNKFKELKGHRKIILTTEKDAVRLAHNPYFPQALKPFTFFLPVTVRILPGVDGHDLAEELRAVVEKS